MGGREHTGESHWVRGGAGGGEYRGGAGRSESNLTTASVLCVSRVSGPEVLLPRLLRGMGCEMTGKEIQGC
jgi:hypothetical protein